jgi:hypothetical protein
MNKLLDLRFVIGLFFTIIGLLLLIQSITGTTTLETGESINRWTGIAFGLFGVFMIVLSFKKDAHDEILEEPKD